MSPSSATNREEAVLQARSLQHEALWLCEFHVATMTAVVQVGEVCTVGSAAGVLPLIAHSPLNRVLYTMLGLNDRLYFCDSQTYNFCSSENSDYLMHI